MRAERKESPPDPGRLPDLPPRGGDGSRWCRSSGALGCRSGAETGAPGHPRAFVGHGLCSCGCPGQGRPVSGSTDPPETWSPGWAGPPRDPGLQASSSTSLRPARPFLQPHLGGALPASASMHGGGQAPKRAPGAEGPSQASVRGGTAQVYRPPAAQLRPPSPGEGRWQSV